MIEITFSYNNGSNIEDYIISLMNKGRYLECKTPNLHMNRTYINMYSRLLLVSGLDYHIKDHTYFVYMKNIKDFDRHVDILLTIERTYFSDIACTYDRDKVKRFFNGV